MLSYNSKSGTIYDLEFGYIHHMIFVYSNNHNNLSSISFLSTKQMFSIYIKFCKNSFQLILLFLDN